MVYAIKGIQEGPGLDGQTPVRREIDEWWFSTDLNDLNQRSLFIYALKAFQLRGLDPNKNDDLSYLNIAGIHGLPRKPWPRNPNNPSEKGGYYCAHGRVTFATWHTPYMMLFEQRMHEEMLKLIPDTFAKEDHKDMIKAANTWRLPFWNWALKKPNWNPAKPDDPINKIPGDGPNVPFVITQTHVPVRTKTETAVPVENPLFQFAPGHNFGQYGVESDKFTWWETCKVTSRWPDLPEKMNDEVWKNLTIGQKSAYAQGANQDYSKITNQLRGKLEDTIKDENGVEKKYFANTLPEAVYRLFGSIDKDGNPVMSYEKFATATFHYGTQTKDYPSLEAIHNNIHDFSGGQGYLGHPSTAAFDPLFWLHHCNVDRLLAIWQFMYTPQTQKWLNTGIATFDGPKAELTPFSTDEKGTMFTSVTCSFKQQEHNYTYPELQRGEFIKDGVYDRQKHIKSLHEMIERTYSTTPKAALLLKSNAKIAQKQMAAMTKENLLVENFPPALVDMAPTSAAEGAQQQVPMGSIPDDAFGEPAHAFWKSNDYVVNVVYERFALGGSPYSITFFLGDVPASHSAYDFASDPTAIGRVYNFSSSVEGRGVDDSGCDNCKQQRDEHALYSGQVILTDYLIERIMWSEPQRGLTLETLDRDEVVEYLKKNLHWRITDFNENLIPKENMPSLKISVAMAEGTHYSEAARPSSYSEYTTLWEVTQGRLGGAADGDI